MKILITGNLGYVGAAVVRHTRQVLPDACLVGLDMGYFGHCLTSQDILPECRVDLQYFADVRKLPEGVLDGVTAVVHLAAISNDPIGNAFESVSFDINHRASVALAAKAKRAGARAFVFASSCALYGCAEDRPRTETSAVSPQTAYAKSKVYAERDLADLAAPAFKVTCLRFATACGMSDRLRLDLVLNDFVAGALASRTIAMLSDGTPWRPLIDVRDMARAIHWAIGRDGTVGGPFLIVNVGRDDRNFRIKELAEAVAGVIPDVTVSVNADAGPDKRSYRVDFSLFRRLAPEHQPTVDLAVTIADLKRGLEAMGTGDRDFRSGRFIRLKVLEELRRKGFLSDRLEWQTEGRLAVPHAA